MLSPWRWVFTQFYQASVQKWGSKNFPEIPAVCAVSVLMCSNLSVIVLVFEALTGRPIGIHVERAFVFAGFLLICAMNYVLFVPSSNVRARRKKLPAVDARQARWNSLKLWSFIVFSTLLPIVMAAVLSPAK